jgi:hypothetical protein
MTDAKKKQVIRQYLEFVIEASGRTACRGNITKGGAFVVMVSILDSLICQADPEDRARYEAILKLVHFELDKLGTLVKTHRVLVQERRIGRKQK